MNAHVQHWMRINRVVIGEIMMVTGMLVILFMIAQAILSRFL